MTNKTKFTERIPILNKNNEFIEIDIVFEKGGLSYTTGNIIQRGYHIISVPIKVTNREDGISIKEFGAFTGFRECLLMVGKTEYQGKAKLKEAIEIYNNNKEKYLEWFENKYNYKFN